MTLTRDAGNALLEALSARHHGAHPAEAVAFVVAVHGRGAGAASILTIADALALTDVCYLAPEAPDGSWYPLPFIAPLEANEPFLGRSLAHVASVLDAVSAAGVSDRSVGLIGFSQGACLALETAIRRPRPYGAVIGLSGGYIGPLDGTRTASARLDGARAFLGCAENDGHIPRQRFQETAQLLRDMGALVDARLYPGAQHTVNDDELSAARTLIASLSAAA